MHETGSASFFFYIILIESLPTNTGLATQLTFSVLQTHIQQHICLSFYSSKTMAGKKYKKAIPSSASGASGTIDVYTIDDDGTNKVYLGWVTDKTKLAFFSRAADRLLNPEKYSKRATSYSSNNLWLPPKRRFQATELLLRSGVDKRAAEIVVKWINDSSINNPEPFIFFYALFGTAPPSFELALNVHHAMHAFDLDREHRGQFVRNAIFYYINTRNNPAIPTAADYKHCMEKIDFDGGVLGCMMTQIMWWSVNRNIDPVAREEIREYYAETEKWDTMVAIGEQVVEKKKKIVEGRGKSAEGIAHGWEGCDVEGRTVVDFADLTASEECF
jgi:hypothetical protein